MNHVLERKLLQGPKHFISMGIIRRIRELYPSPLTDWRGGPTSNHKDMILKTKLNFM